VLFLERYLPAPPDGPLVGMPDRHALVALPLADERSLGGLAGLVHLCHGRFTEEPGAITDQVHWRRGESYARVACGVRGDGTPWVAPPDDFDDAVARLSQVH
jgi:hypothetical protein